MIFDGWLVGPKLHIVLIASGCGLVFLGALGLVFLTCRSMQSEAESLRESLIPVVGQVSNLYTWMSLDINRRKEFSLGQAGTMELAESEAEIRRILVALDRSLKAGDRHKVIFSKLEKECRALAEDYDHCRVAAALTYGHRNQMMAELDQVMTRQLELNKQIRQAISAENVYLSYYPATVVSENRPDHAPQGLVDQLREIERHLLEVFNLLTKAVGEMNHHLLAEVESLLPALIDKAGEFSEVNGGEEAWLIEGVESFNISVKSLNLRARAWMHRYEKQGLENGRLLSNLRSLEKRTRQVLEVSIHNFDRTSQLVKGVVFAFSFLMIIILSAMVAAAVILRDHQALKIPPRPDEGWPRIQTEAEEGKGGLAEPAKPAAQSIIKE